MKLSSVARIVAAPSTLPSATMNKSEAMTYLTRFAKDLVVRLKPFAEDAGISILSPEAEWDSTVDGCWADVAQVSSRKPRLVIDLWLDRWAADHLQLSYGVGCRRVERATMTMFDRRLAERYGIAISRSDTDFDDEGAWKTGKEFSKPQHYARPIKYAHEGASSGYCLYVFDTPPFSARRRNEVLTRATAFVLDAAEVWHKRDNRTPSQGRSRVIPTAEASSGDDIANAANEAAEGARQGFRVGPAERLAIEAEAIARATAYYRGMGYHVRTVGKPYDLECRSGKTILYVEVKGTTTAGEAVLLTPNEVAFAREHAGRMELFVLSGVELIGSNASIKVVGGEQRVLPQWDIDTGVLAPALYRYSLPLPR